MMNVPSSFFGGARGFASVLLLAGGVSAISACAWIGHDGGDGGTPKVVLCSSSWLSPKGFGLENAVDGDWRTVWKAVHRNSGGARDCELVLDLGERRKIFGFVYIPAPYSPKWRVGKYRVDISDDGRNWSSKPIASGTLATAFKGIWPNAKERMSKVLFEKPVEGRFMRLTAISAGKTAGAAEFAPILDPRKYPWKGETLARLKGTRMAPSVHLGFHVPGDSNSYYVEVVPDSSQPGTYFMAIGFGGGYFGIQELGDGRKRVLFSVWDSHHGNDSKRVPSDRRTLLVAKGEGVTARRFGGEGTGGQSFVPFDWKIGERYLFLVKAKVVGPRTEYSAYFRPADAERWKLVATFSKLADGRALRGFYCFVEDFKRDFKSFHQAKRAEFLNPWSEGVDGVWRPVTSARFSRDGNPNTNIDAGAESDGAFLATGGATENNTTKLWGTVKGWTPGVRPLDLP